MICPHKFMLFEIKAFRFDMSGSDTQRHSNTKEYRRQVSMVIRYPEMFKEA